MRAGNVDTVMTDSGLSRAVPAVMASIVAAMLMGGTTGAIGAVTDLADGPLANGATSTTAIKPNIAFIVDDSGSMNDQNMPDDDGTNKSKKCWGWYNYNTLAYNPSVTYKPPYKVGGTVYSDGVTRYSDASFTAAVWDGYFANPGYTYSGDSSSNGVVDLSNTGNLPTSASTKYYYTYPSNSSDNGSTSCLTDSKYTAVTSSANIAAPNVTTGSAEAKTNYANWYSYYRRRAFAMKAATSESFSGLSDQYRVGLFFIASAESGASSPGPNHDLKIDTFSGTQRSTFFSRLQGFREAGWTPLRGALARIGRMYAGKIANWDPVQYSCQQNFTILSTDGYWNTNYETSSYGPYKIDGATAVGNEDGMAARPYYDGASTITQKRTNSLQKRTVQLQQSTGVLQTCTGRTDPGKRCASNGSGWVTATGTCTPSGSGASQVSCRYAWSSPANVGSCTEVPASTSSPYTVLNATDCTNPATVWTNVDSCTATTPDSNGASTECQYAGWTDWANASTCAPLAPSSGPAYTVGTAVECQSAPSGGTSDSLADVAYYYYQTDLRTPDLNNCSNTIGTTTYSSLCDNNVLGAGKDVNQQQHMTTFTIGLGASGTIKYESNYENAAKDTDNSTTQYYDINNGTANWPDPITNSGEQRIDDLWHAAVNGRGTYYSAGNATSLSSGIKSALSGITARTGSSSAAATSNLEPVAGDNYVYVALYRTVWWDGDLKAYTIDPNTGELSSTSVWSAQAKLDATVAAAGAGNDGRAIKYFNSSAVDKLKDFTSTNLSADSKSSYFENKCSGATPALSQCGAGSTLTAAQKTLADTADNVVKYLRGQNGYEIEAGNANQLFRNREHVLGDIVNAVPVYMKKPPFSYDKFDATYGQFKSDNASRAPTVYAAANDGMVHAIDASDDQNTRGSERWAFVPSFVMPNMYKLADSNYGGNHRYFVDGSPTVADICTTLSTTDSSLCAAKANWKTILVGGLNKGGCGYYALDVTDPTAPKGLWEFSDANLGYSFGNPVVTKRKDGKWVVIVSSGYNNVPGNDCGSTGGDGNGHVFVLDAATGALLDDIPTYTSAATAAGSTTTPSGLAKLNAWVDNEYVNVASRLYGGDLLGNLWRIDFDDNYGTSGKEATLLGQFTVSGYKQPVTVKPELGEVTSGAVTYPVVLVGTGKYLGSTDSADTHQQSIYAIKDKLTDTGYGSVRDDSHFVSRTLTQTTDSSGRAIRTVSGSSIDWADKDGWYIDLNPDNLSPTERVNVDMQLQYNILTAAANVPDQNACNVGGYAWLYFIDIDTGRNLSTSGNSAIGVKLSSNALVAGIKTVKLSNGKTVTIVTDTAGGVGVESNPSGTGAAAGAVRRTMWREIPD